MVNGQYQHRWTTIFHWWNNPSLDSTMDHHDTFAIQIMGNVLYNSPRPKKNGQTSWGRNIRMSWIHHFITSSLSYVIAVIAFIIIIYIIYIYIIHLFGDGWKPWRASYVLSDQRAKCPATGLPGIDSSTNDSLMKWFHLGKWSYFTHLNLGASYGDDFPYPLVNIQKTMERSTIFNG